MRHGLLRLEKASVLYGLTKNRHTIEAGFVYSIPSRGNVQLDVLLDLVESQGTRRLIPSSQLDRGWRDVLECRILLTSILVLRRPSVSPELAEYKASLGVYAFGDLEWTFSRCYPM